MKAKVTELGVVIPKILLQGIEEVEIRKDADLIMVIPVGAGDPLLALGKNPVECGVSDASEEHDRYLYGSGS